MKDRIQNIINEAGQIAPVKRLRPVVDEFKAFIAKGNVVQLAVGLAVGAAFGKVVESFGKNILSPLVAKIGGQPDLGWYQWGPVFIGNFITDFLNFLITAAIVFFVVVKPMNKLMELLVRKEEAKTPEEILLLREIRNALIQKAPMTTAAPAKE